MIKEYELDPDQMNFLLNIDYRKSNIWIQGMPGTGKSTLLTYIVKKIKLENSKSSILIIGFNRITADVIL